jgi:hypothetical protein
LVSTYAFLEGNVSKFDFTLAYPDLESFNGDFDPRNFDVNNLIPAFSKATIKYMEKEKGMIEQQLGKLQKGLEKRLKAIENFLSRKAQTVAKGYSLVELDELKVLSVTNQPIPKAIEPIFQEIQKDYQKLVQKMEPSINKAATTAKQFLENKISEKKFNDTVSNHGFMKDIRESFQKIINKQTSNIEKKYSTLASTVEKQLQGMRKGMEKASSQLRPISGYLRFDQKGYSRGNVDIFKSHSAIVSAIQGAIEQIMKKESLITFDNIGAYEFFANSRALPRSLQIALTNALVNKESFPFLKEALSNFKSDLHRDIFQSYAEVIGRRTNVILTRLLQNLGSSIRKEYFRSDPVITFVEGGKKILIPVIEMGVVSEMPMKSLSSLLGDRIKFESQHEGGASIHRVLATIPSFGCDYADLVWERHHHGKEITLHRALLLVSWHSFLEENKFYMNLIHHSAGLYSDRVKNGVEDTLIQVERSMTSG